MTKEIIVTNDYQTKITKELLDMYPDWVRDQFMNIVTNIPFVKYMIGTERKRACELPRDEEGKIVIDVTHPHILEDMDYFRQPAIFFEENGCYTFLKPNKAKGSEFQKWFQEEKRRCLEGYIRESDGEWVTGYLYWYLNYSPIKLNRQTKKGVWHQVEHLPDFWEEVYYGFHAFNQARLGGKHLIELARRGASKAHPYSEYVYTPNGRISWKDVTIGTKLFGTYGNITTVTDIPFDDVANIYEVTLKDGRKVRCSEDHMWTIHIGHRTHLDTVSTKELLSLYESKRKVSERNPSGVEHRCSIMKNAGVDFESQPTRVDPYTFGVLLGDGCFRHNSCYLTLGQQDAESILANIPYEHVKWSSECAYRLCIDNWISILKSYGLNFKMSDEKFIPDEYKYNSRDVRYAILAGLIDTDGCIAKQGCVSFSTASERLCNDIVFIARSLGINCSFTIDKAGYKSGGEYIQCKDSYNVTFFTDERIARLERKQPRMHNSNYAHSQERKTRIVDVKFVGQERAKCVTVDSDDHCYLINEFVATHNSYRIASILNHNLILGEDSDSQTDVNSILTAYTKEYLGDKDGTLSKFEIMRTATAKYTQFKRTMLKASPSEMIWRQGYEDDNKIKHSTNNIVLGLSVKDDESKIRGKRGMIFFEEMGSFPNLGEVYGNVKDSVKDGDNVFATIYLVGTAGDDKSDFAGAKSLLYEPDNNDLLSFENVWDFPGKGRERFGFFFPAYMSRSGCMDKDGNSDVVKALLAILMEHYKAKSTGDMSKYTKRKAELCITPADAMIKVTASVFPVNELNERIRQLETDTHAYDDVYIGDLVDTGGGNIVFRVNDDVPIRKWPISDNSTLGALEIYEMPVKGQDGKAMRNRYVIGVDPIDNDQAESTSLYSMFVFDMMTERIVAEYTGRKPLANDNYKLTYNAAVFYNAVVMYEANKKMIYAYFAKKNAIWMLAETPQYLRDRQLVKYSNIGSAKYGVSVNAAINKTADEQIETWLLTERPVDVRGEDGEMHQVMMANLYFIRCKALLDEMVNYEPELRKKNVDRIRALSQCMLYREQFIILYGGSIPESTQKDVSDDEFFDRDWKARRAYN